MIQFVDYAPTQTAPRIAVTAAACMRNARTGIIEVTFARSVAHPRGITTYQEAATLIWPAEALTAVNAEIGIAIPVVISQILQ